MVPKSQIVVSPSAIFHKAGRAVGAARTGAAAGAAFRAKAGMDENSARAQAVARMQVLIGIMGIDCRRNGKRGLNASAAAP